MGDEDRCCPQVMQSSWYHNHYNRAWYTLDCLREVLTTEARVVLCKDSTYFNCVIYDKGKEYYGVHEEMLEATCQAHENWKRASE